MTAGEVPHCSVVGHLVAFGSSDLTIPDYVINHEGRA
jgi:hypothetical protein